MGICYSRTEREEMVSRCKARKRYMKHFVKARRDFSVSNAIYLRSLGKIGSALVQFAAGTNTHIHHRFPPPPMSPSSDTWTSVTVSPVQPLPSQPESSSWDFWDPFMPTSKAEEEWEAATIGQPPPPPPPPTSVDSGMVTMKKSKDFVEIIKEIDECFCKGSDAGGQLSLFLEVPCPSLSNQNFSGGKGYNCGRNLSPLLWTWGSNSKLNGFGNGKACGDSVTGNHCSTVERLYVWEQKLYHQVKTVQTLKVEHEKRVAQLRKLEGKSVDYVKIEKMKSEVKKLESQMTVASQAIETTSAQIVGLRETELYPQLLELVKGLMHMWRSMYECHQVQIHIVEQLKYLNIIPPTEPTSDIHRQSTLQLELELQQWHVSFCNLIKAQQDYIKALAGWLRLSVFQFSKNPLNTGQESRIYSLCEEWHSAIDRIPDKATSEGIKSFLTLIHAIVIQQAEEHKQKKKTDSAFKELEKKAIELKSLETKYDPDTARTKNPVAEKQAKIEILKAKAEEEKVKLEKFITATMEMTLNNLQTGFPDLFQAIQVFSSVCTEAFELVYNKTKSMP